MKLPKKKKHWYHATTIDKAEKIINQGLLKDISGLGLYFANRCDYAAGFVHMNDIPNFDQPVVVFKIPTKDIPNIQLGCDHNPAFFPKDLITAVSFGCEIPVSINNYDCTYEY